jgi:hypothetical protein
MARKNPQNPNLEESSLQEEIATKEKIIAPYNLKQYGRLSHWYAMGHTLLSTVYQT